jgi:hypothetical protein
MNSFLTRWKTALRGIAILGFITALLVVWRDHRGTLQHAKSNANAAAATETRKSQSHRLSPSSAFNPSSKSQPRERKPRPEPRSADPNEQQLKNLVAAEDLNAVHDQLQTLADAHQLAKIGGLLKTWCREGDIALVQWSLDLSSESDAPLSLTLHAEALSNPSEAIREIAAAELENVSGIRFTDSAHAKFWLASHPRP